MNHQTQSHSSHYIVGTDKPQTEIYTQPKDPYYWARRKAAEKLNRDEVSLMDEPDFDSRQDIDRE